MAKSANACSRKFQIFSDSAVNMTVNVEVTIAYYKNYQISLDVYKVDLSAAAAMVGSIL